MPIPKENRHFYKGDWPEISRQIREREGHCCKFCGVPDKVEGWRDPKGKFHQLDPDEMEDTCRRYYETDGGDPIKIILTVAHLDQDPSNNDPDNLAALCQRCHLNHDRPYNIQKRKERKRARLAVKDLFE